MINRKTLIIILVLVVFTIGYFNFLEAIRYDMPTTQDYKENPPCEFEKLDNGYTQLPNCAQYKFLGGKPKGIGD